ncbi:hypothetical protein EMCRGX_G029067, partial [Ephydatia muelleri]
NKLQRQLISSAQSVPSIKSFLVPISSTEQAQPSISNNSMQSTSYKAAITTPISPAHMPSTPTPSTPMPSSPMPSSSMPFSPMPSSPMPSTSVPSTSMSSASISFASLPCTLLPFESSSFASTATPIVSMLSQSVFKTMPVPYDIAQILYHENASVSAVDLWQQCENTLSDYDKYCILTHHIRPKEDYKFPLVQKAGHPRKCCTSMLSNDYIYSPSSNSIFCLPCSLFVPIDTNKKGLKNRCSL